MQPDEAKAAIAYHLDEMKGILPLMERYGSLKALPAYGSSMEQLAGTMTRHLERILELRKEL